MSSDQYNVMKRGDGGDDDGVEFSHMGGRPRRKSLCITVIVLAVLLVVATVVAVTFIALYATRSSSSSDVCQSEACFDLSVQMLGAMDESADPCEDFYNFTCGNWDIIKGIKPGVYSNNCGLYY